MRIFLTIFVLLFSLPLFSKLAKNSKAPDFSLKEVVTGAEYKLSSYKDKIVVLEWHCPNCAFTQRHTEAKTMVKLYNKYEPKGVVWFGIDSSGEDKKSGSISYYMWKQKYGIEYDILEDGSGKVGHLYGAKVTPHMVIINKGIVIYQGAIDDDMFGDKDSSKRINYVDLVLASLLKNGKFPKGFKQFMWPYGCGIKY